MSETPWWLSLVLSWVPFFLTLAIYLYALRAFRRMLSTSDGRPVADVVLELVNETKRSNDRSK